MSRLNGNENTGSCRDKDDFHAIEQLMEQYGRAIFSYCYHLLRKKEDAEDAVQDIFLKAYQNYSASRINHFSLWIYKVAYNHCMNVIRHTLKYGRIVPMDDSLAINAKTPEDTLDQAETRLLVQKALDALPVSQKNIVILRAIHHLSYDAISKITRQKPASIRKVYERAKKKMARFLEVCEKEAVQDEKREA